jgi:transcription elongation GreA/GreB family factor
MSREQPATDRQLRYLRNLACQRGESFSYPQSRSQASAEIERLKGRRRESLIERRIEQLQVSTEIAALGDAAAIKDDEVTGYGSSARWC